MSNSDVFVCTYACTHMAIPIQLVELNFCDYSSAVSHCYGKIIEFGTFEIRSNFSTSV